MACQLDRLVETMDLSNVSLRVVPFDVGLHAGLMSGPFTLLRFPVNGDGKPTEPPTIYMDGFTGDLYSDKPQEIERYDEAFNSIWSASLNHAETNSLLRQAVKELRQ